MCVYLCYQCMDWVWPESLHCVALVGENIIAISVVESEFMLSLYS